MTKQRAHRRAAKMIRELRTLGYRVEPFLSLAESSMNRRVFRPWVEELKRRVPTN